MAKGFYTNIELVDTLLVDINRLPTLLYQGQNIAFCDSIAKMGQKLALLKNGIQADLDSKDKQIEHLKDQLRSAGYEVEDMSAEEFVKKYGKKDGDNNGEG